MCYFGRRLTNDFAGSEKCKENIYRQIRAGEGTGVERC